MSGSYGGQSGQGGQFQGTTPGQFGYSPYNGGNAGSPQPWSGLANMPPQAFGALQRTPYTPPGGAPGPVQDYPFARRSTPTQPTMPGGIPGPVQDYTRSVPTQPTIPGGAPGPVRDYPLISDNFGSGSGLMVQDPFASRGPPTQPTMPGGVPGPVGGSPLMPGGGFGSQQQPAPAFGGGLPQSIQDALNRQRQLRG